MSLGLLGRKKGMTQIFGESGEIIPVTVVEAGPCTVVQKKSRQKEGYDAVQLRFEEIMKEFRGPAPEGLEAGAQIDVQIFQAGDPVDVKGLTKGRGFQGVMKRHGKHGGPDSHGSDFHRRPGSIGMRTWPGRVLKNTRLPGRMGHDAVMIRNLRVVKVQPQENLLLLKGAVPGARGSVVMIYHRGKDFENRLKNGLQGAIARIKEDGNKKDNTENAKAKNQ